MEMKPDMLSHETSLDSLENSLKPKTLNELIAESKKRDLKILEYIKDISGPNAQGKGKAHVFIDYYEQNGDGTLGRTIEKLEFDKPIVSIFYDEKKRKYHVLLDFLHPGDMDLQMTFRVIERFKKPENSILWLPVEEENGYYKDEKGLLRKIYYPMLSMTLVPIGKETRYQMVGFNPDPPGLAPGADNGYPTIVHFIFDEDTFEITDKEIEFSMKELQEEAEAELELEGEYGNY